MPLSLLGNVRTPVQAARAGIARELEGNVGMSIVEAARFARTLLQHGDVPVVVRIDGQVLHIGPADVRDAGPQA